MLWILGPISKSARWRMRNQSNRTWKNSQEFFLMILASFALLVSLSRVCSQYMWKIPIIHAVCVVLHLKFIFVCSSFILSSFALLLSLRSLCTAKKFGAFIKRSLRIVERSMRWFSELQKMRILDPSQQSDLHPLKAFFERRAREEQQLKEEKQRKVITIKSAKWAEQHSVHQRRAVAMGALLLVRLRSEGVLMLTHNNSRVWNWTRANVHSKRTAVFSALSIF